MLVAVNKFDLIWFDLLLFQVFFVSLLCMYLRIMDPNTSVIKGEYCISLLRNVEGRDPSPYASKKQRSVAPAFLSWRI